jgi:hypothetical protein
VVLLVELEESGVHVRVLQPRRPRRARDEAWDLAAVVSFQPIDTEISKPVAGALELLSQFA